MNINRTLFLVAFISLLSSKGLAQESKIENTQLQLSGDNLIITYDVVGSSSLDNVWLDIKTTSNKSIHAKTFSGDIGKKILVGKKKKIVWNMKVDGIDLQGEELNVKVLASKPKVSLNVLTDIVEIQRGRQSKSRDNVINKNGSKISGKLESRFASDNLKFVSTDGNNLTLNQDEIEKIKNRVCSRDTVYLKNGDRMSGTIKEIYPNDKIILRSKRDNQYSIQYADIKSVSTYSSNLGYYGRSYFAMPIIQMSDPFLLGLKFGVIDNWGYYGQFTAGLSGTESDQASTHDIHIVEIGASKYIFSTTNVDIHATLGVSYSSYNSYDYDYYGTDNYDGTKNSLGVDLGLIGQYHHFVFNLSIGIPFKTKLFNVGIGVGYSLSAK